MKKRNDFGLIFWMHLVLIILLWTSPLWLDFKLIASGIIIYCIQLLIFKDCLLTKAQFREKKRSRTFYWYYLNKIGFKFDKEKVRFAADNYFPWIILGLALFFQIIIKISPIIRW